MLKFCYGRFNLPHVGHKQLFDAADIILIANGKSATVPFASRAICINSYLSAKPCIAVASLFEFLAAQTQPVTLILGEDNEKLGRNVSERLTHVTVQYIDRPSGAISSSAIRENIRVFRSAQALVDSGLAVSIEHADHLLSMEN